MTMNVANEKSLSTEAIVLEPPKLYLDTCHLIRIARLRKKQVIPHEDAYRTIDKCIREHHFGLIFNLAAPMEWIDGDATRDSALEIAEVVDSAKLQYELDADTFVYLREVLVEVSRQDPQLSLPEFDVFFVRDPNVATPRVLSVLAQKSPRFFEGEELSVNPANLPPKQQFFTVQQLVQSDWELKEQQPDFYDRRVKGYKSALKKDTTTFHDRSNTDFTNDDYARWMKQFLKVDRIIEEMNPGVDCDALLHAVDLNKCPAVRLYLNAYKKRIQSGHEPKDNDVDDWMYIPAIVYADLVLSEKNLTHFITSADSRMKQRVTHDPSQFVTWLRKWM